MSEADRDARLTGKPEVIHLAEKPAFWTIAAADRQMDDLPELALISFVDECVGDLAPFDRLLLVGCR